MAFGPRKFKIPLLMYKFHSVTIFEKGTEIAKFEGDYAKEKASEFIHTHNYVELDVITHLKVRKV